MSDFKDKKSKICFIGMLISLAILLIVFYATDGLLGDKEFSEYTHDDWSIAILPLSIIIVSAISTLTFALITILFFKKKSTEIDAIIPPISIPLTNIQEVDEAGILYLDNEGNSANIHYYDAYKGWCKSKSIKKSKPKYICDRTKAEGWKLIFYTNPRITFYADPSQEEFWIEVLNEIASQGFPSFDWD